MKNEKCLNNESDCCEDNKDSRKNNLILSGEEIEMKNSEVNEE